MDPLVEGSLDWSRLRRADLGQLAELRTAIEYFDDPVERIGEAELVEHFDAPGTDAGTEAVVGRDRGGTIVAYAWNRPRGFDVGEPRVWLDGGVHPAWRHQQIGRRLVQWQLDRAVECHAEALGRGAEMQRPLWVGRYADVKLQGLTGLLERAGLSAENWYFDMHVSFRGDEGDNTALPALPDTGGIQLAPYHPSLSEAVRRAHNEAFAASPGAHTVSRATWEHQMRRSVARPQWSWVALDDGEVVGYAMSSAYVQDWGPQGFSEGWTDRIGVRPAWRGRNLGKALLICSMRSFLDAGLEGAGLGVDTANPDGAVGLFEQIGYQSEEMVALYGREFGPGTHTG